MFAVKNCFRFAALTALVCALALTGCGKKDDAPKAEGEPKPAPPGPTPPPPMPPAPVDLTKAKPDGTYTAKAFLAEQKKDGDFLLNRHAGKVVEVTGEIKGYGYGARENVAAIILDTGEEITFDMMVCQLADKEPWKKALPTQQVILRAEVPSKVNPAGILAWQIVEVKGSPPKTFSAEEFSRASATEPEKYKDKPLFITGTITKTQENGGFLLVFLKAQEGGEVQCVFGDEFQAIAFLTVGQKMALKPGAMVKILGKYVHIGVSGKVRDCILLEPAP